MFEDVTFEEPKVLEISGNSPFKRREVSGPGAVYPEKQAERPKAGHCPLKTVQRKGIRLHFHLLKTNHEKCPRGVLVVAQQ